MTSGPFPQLRKDPIVDRWVLIAPDRANRPGALVAHAEELPSDDADCPFCEGREERTPPELFSVRHGTGDNEPGWSVRVVPNQFPAARNEIGSHELIIECPEHVASVASFSKLQFEKVIESIRSRMLVHRSKGHWKYAQWFKNHGLSAGASLSHAHSQVICLPNVPTVVQMEVDAVSAGRLHNRKCVFCELITNERAIGQRVVFEQNGFIALSANAARFPFEMWFLPMDHQVHFEDVDDYSMPRLASALHRLIMRNERRLGRHGYNLLLHTGPWTGTDFHWHFELLPRITGIAGFELSSGIFINPIAPEDAVQ